MRISILRWRRTALNVALAAACASGLHLAGCVRSSSRDVGADLSKQAADEAIRAERAIASRNARISPNGSSDPMRQPGSRSTLLGTVTPKKSENPLAKLLSEQPDKYPAGDPFVQSDASTDALSRLLANRETLPEARHTSEQPATADIQLTQHSSQEKEFNTRDGSAVAKPLTARDYPVASLSQKDALKESIVKRHWPEQEAVASRSDGPQLPISQTTTSQTNNSRMDQHSLPFGLDDDVADKLPLDFEQNDLGQWKQIEPASVRSNRPVAASLEQAPSPNRTEPVKNSLRETHVQQERVNALLTQASLLKERGELHAAYRSALLARNLVEYYQFPIAGEAANPTLIAQEIAAKIWGTPESRGNAKPPSDLPLIQPKRSRSKQHDLVFQTSSHFMNWQPTAEEIEQELQLVESKLDESRRSVMGAVLFPEDNNIDQPSLTASNQSADVVLQTSGTHRVQSGFSAEEIEQLDRFAQQSRAKNLDINESDRSPIARPLLKSPGQQPEQVAQANGPRSMPGVTLAERRPLLAPALQSNPFADEVRSTATPSPQNVPAKNIVLPVETVASSPQNQLQWGVIAFVLALFSSLIGLKLSKGNQAQPELEPGVLNREMISEEENSSLKISKAA